MADAKYAIWTEGDVEEGGLRKTCEQYGDAMKLADAYARRHPGQSEAQAHLEAMQDALANARQKAADHAAGKGIAISSERLLEIGREVEAYDHMDVSASRPRGWPDEEAIVSPCPACEILTVCGKHDRRNR